MDGQTCKQRIDGALTRIHNKHGHKFVADYMSSGYRLADEAGQLGRGWPRLPAGKFALWLEAFEEGLDFATR